MEKKRKIDSESRKFKDQWNIQYFVIESSNKALCLICNESIAVLKEYNMKRHYETKHSQNNSKYTGIVRTEKFEALKRGLKSQQSLFTKVKTKQEAATRASFRVALEIAKRGKPFTDGEMIKECIIAVVEEMCPEKVNLLKTVSMSANTVARRVENIDENISSQLFDKNGHVEWFSLALDESTDVSDTAQVLIYIRGVDKSYEVHEELLDMYSIHGTTTGTDIFKGVEMAINKKNLRWKNLKCITTDGGKNMSGKDKGVVALVSKAVENDGGSKPLVLHCIIHQQSLCGKCLDMSDVLKPVISTVNFIRSFGLNHRQFRQFIAEIGETDLPYHTALRWLSCGKVLQRFFELRAVIEIFLNEKHRPLTELQNNAWLWKLAFYVDLTKHVNELNLRLQGENLNLPDLYTNIKSFRMKLILFQSQLRSERFSHFKTCEIFSHTTETEFPIDFAIETLSALKINFDTRFSDFDAIAKQIKIFQNPFDADIETLAPELQMEMIDLQCSDIIKNKYENSSLLEFYKSLPLTQFDNLHKFARGLFSVFGTTYLCEKTFSKMNLETPALKECLTTKPVLHLFKEGLPCQLFCDASLQGIAGILKQQHPDGTLHPVQYYSRALRPHEKNYTITELECLAVIDSVEKFRIYLAALVLLVISALLVEDVRSSSKVYTYNLLRAIEETVTEIQSDIQKKDRLAEVGKLFEIDSELDKINRKLQDVTPQRPDDLSRSGGSYGSAELWQMKENFETAEDRLSKLEQRQRMSNKDINDKLEKMINLMTKFYKKNSNTTHIYENTARTTGGQTRTQASNVNALLENLQEFERKFNEEITVIKANVENDVNYLRSRATECDTPPEQVTQDENVDYDDLGDYDDLLKQTRSGGISPAESALEQFSTTLNNTRERIRRDVSTSLRNLDTKIAGIAFTSTRCRQPVIEAAESRTLETRVRPQRSEDPQCTPRSQILRPQSCAALFHAGERCQGTYLVYFDGTNPELAFCDMLSEGGGWTVSEAFTSYLQIGH
ncbi:EPM2AIP1 [Cordylochernes scorpioides]|uniref:EPM2AIP1 n=1 Tax=Cordylochernes scorpioides TaxID=51811 RepID=A0ABY6LRR1_9ARAC|nr:EPM2AIP1 [Cordylochernes scorpioides]